jgi:hypothetical protein
MNENFEQNKNVTTIRTEEDFFFNRAISIAKHDSEKGKQISFYEYIARRYMWAKAMRHTYRGAIIALENFRILLPLAISAAILNTLSVFIEFARGMNVNIPHAIFSISVCWLAGYAYILRKNAMAVVKAFNELDQA